MDLFCNETTVTWGKSTCPQSDNNLSHMPMTGIEPNPYWWETITLTTEPVRHLQMKCLFCKKNENMSYGNKKIHTTRISGLNHIKKYPPYYPSTPTIDLQLGKKIPHHLPWPLTYWSYGPLTHGWSLPPHTGSGNMYNKLLKDNEKAQHTHVSVCLFIIFKVTKGQGHFLHLLPTQNCSNTDEQIGEWTHRQMDREKWQKIITVQNLIISVKPSYEFNLIQLRNSTRNFCFDFMLNTNVQWQAVE